MLHTTEDIPFHEAVPVWEHIALSILRIITIGIVDMDPDTANKGAKEKLAIPANREALQKFEADVYSAAGAERGKEIMDAVKSGEGNK